MDQKVFPISISSLK